MERYPNKPLRILLIDDDPVTHVIAKALLSGHKTVHTYSGFEALKVFTEQKGRFDLILTDIMMPKMSGYQFTNHLRKINGKTPVILMSGTKSEYVASEALLCGAITCIENPLKADEIQNAISFASGQFRTPYAKVA